MPHNAVTAYFLKHTKKILMLNSCYDSFSYCFANIGDFMAVSDSHH